MADARALRWEGTFPVLVSPFDEDDRLVLEEVRAQVRFCIDAGADGLVYPGVVSEFFTLSHEEFESALEAILAEAGGRIPVIAGISAPSSRGSAALAGKAAELGASGVMAMLPYVSHFFEPDLQFARNHFAAIANACPLPIVLQNARMGYPLSLERVDQILASVPTVRYLKEEVAPTTHRLTEAASLFGDRLDGIFGGVGGIYLLSELARGATGSMPSPAVVDRVGRIFTSWKKGDDVEARRISDSLAPLAVYELLYNVAVIKEILRRRGVLDNTRTRVPAPRLDAIDLAELEAILSNLLSQ